MSAPEFTIVAEGLRKNFKKTEALKGVDLKVRAGTVCGLLGPNGAGKTTTVRLLCTLLRPDGGRAEVAGHDIAREARQVRTRIGLIGQNTTTDHVLTGRQNLMLFGRLYHLGKRQALRRADALLEQFGLGEAADRQVKHYSGGMRRRLDIAASFIAAPDVLFLDEPTTGQDPRHRSEVWRSVRSLVDQGTTVLLTTHFLDEADQLCDDIAVVDQGQVITTGSPEQLKSRIGGDQVDLLLRHAHALPQAAKILARVATGEPETVPEARRVSAPVTDRLTALSVLARELEAAGVAVEDISLRRPTLDEVFLRLTGSRPKSAQEAEGDDEILEEGVPA
ncbi:ATP-binding cassette domain-containing protein [Streptomyces iconiensis]|uniref:ATP-binding cassette domain-containing protein n=1 Tax=Streptomyces iconiensis TaxID=1384038 RepID=A0ABT7A6B8_9ACTN|nr:ATP-binding cassette domain-containing protein [Streptomyces iconiensis]MDJ1136877.1 ATP-binding cassette domain-containing protein [Streptomyces iconiensis]